MLITRRLTNEGASDESLHRLETEVGSRLPEDYRAFLKEFNGGEPDPFGFVFYADDGPSDSSVRYFLTLDPNATHYNVFDFLR